MSRNFKKEGECFIYLVSMSKPQHTVFAFDVANRHPLMTLMTKTFNKILINPPGIHRLHKFGARDRGNAMIKLFMIPTRGETPASILFNCMWGGGYEYVLPISTVFQLKPTARLACITEPFFRLTIIAHPFWRIHITVEA